MVAAASRAESALQDKLSATQSELAAANASRTSLQEQRTMLNDQLSEVKAELVAKADSADSSGKRVVELTESLKAADRRASQAEAAAVAASETHSRVLDELKVELSKRSKLLEGVKMHASHLS